MELALSDFSADTLACTNRYSLGFYFLISIQKCSSYRTKIIGFSLGTSE